MSTAIEEYLARVKKNFPDFQDFGLGSEEFDMEERAYKMELVKLYQDTVAESLRNFPADEEHQITVGKNISALFKTRLQHARNQSQNLVGYRYFNPLISEGNDYAKWARLVKQLIDADLQLSERIDQFVGGLYELIKEEVISKNIAFAALSRSVTSLLLMFSDPSKHVVIKTQEFNRALSAFEKAPMTGRLTGQEYQRVLEFLNEIKENLVQAGRNPRDLIDVQSLIWVGDEKYSSSDQLVEGLEEMSQIESQDTVIPRIDAAGTLNRILYGPPGTGKTYRTVDEALSILDPLFFAENRLDRVALKKRFDELFDAKKIRFITFHQSFSYEDFVEGLRPVTDVAGNLTYKVEPGVFKSLCESAQGVASSTDLGQVENSSISSHISMIKTGDELGKNYVIGKVTSDVVFVTKKRGSSVPFAWIFLNRLCELVHSGILTLDDILEKRVFEKVPDLQLEKHLVNGYGNILFLLVGAILKSPGNDAPASRTPKVLIIDEINRGNVSRIFGELITLVETSKRMGNPEALQVTLPYSKESFGIPNNVYLIGTMNTADRSLSALDIALRRRFAFIEMRPQPEQLDQVNVANGINVGTLLRSMNQRIEVLLDRDHSLGHTYFLPLIQTPTLLLLATIFREQIVPLLEEYFFEDWERIHFVLNDHRKEDSHKFITRPQKSLGDILGEKNAERFQDNRWEINQAAFDLPESYIQVYKDQ